MTAPETYTRREVKKLLRSRLTLRSSRDNKDILVRLLDLDLALIYLVREHADEARAIIVCGVYQVQFRDAESILGMDHVSIHDTFSSGIAHLTLFLNGDVRRLIAL